MEANKKNKPADGLTEIKATEQFWNAQYKSATTFWDIGQISPPLKNYIDQLTNKNLRILIPGCGNAYEASYLLSRGFTNITVIDIAPFLVKKLRKQFPANSPVSIIAGDFFLHNAAYDLIIEQTFFCALLPQLRKDYVKKMSSLLAPGGKLTGVLFNRNFEKEGPPFGGSKEEYEELFTKDFRMAVFDECYNSFVKRKGKELFIIFQKK